MSYRLGQKYGKYINIYTNILHLQKTIAAQKSRGPASEHSLTSSSQAGPPPAARTGRRAGAVKAHWHGVPAAGPHRLGPNTPSHESPTASPATSSRPRAGRECRAPANQDPAGHRPRGRRGEPAGPGPGSGPRAQVPTPLP